MSRILRNRAEDRPAPTQDAPNDEDANDDQRLDPVRNLFHGYQLPRDGTAIEIGPCEGVSSPGNGYSLRLSLAAFVYGKEGEDTTERQVDFETADEEATIRFLVERRDPAASWTILGRRVLRSRLRVMLRDSEPPRVRFVGTDSHDQEQTLEHWRRVAVRPSARAVVEGALRLIDPDIREIVVLPHPRQASEVVLIYSETKRLPLRSLGDGIQRLFQVVLAIVAAPGGLVLIDEFENGLHWSVQRLAWDLLFKLAEEQDVQLVVTTHSWDCVTSFRDAMIARGGDDGQLLHLGRSIRKSNHGAFVSTTYDREALAQVTKAGLEVR